jgi:phage gpG-like protein
MSGIILKLSLKDMGAGRAVQQFVDKLDRPQEFLQEAGIYLLSSVQRNFVEQGRPVPWKPSKRAEAWHGKTLRKSGRLMNSITMRVWENILKIGLNVIYAAIQHFGGTINKTVSVKAHTRYYKHTGRSIKQGGKSFHPFAEVKSHSRKMNITILARPFLMAQDEDWPVIVQMGERYFIPVRFVE